MTNQADVELVRNAYEAFNKGDMATIDQLFADDVVFHIPGRSPVAGEWQSKAKVFEWFGLMAERSGGAFHVEVSDVVASKVGVVVLVTERAEYSGKTLAVEGADVVQVVGEKIVELRHRSGDQPAWDEFWS